MSVMVIAGGLSAERDVSLRSGRRLAESLREEGEDVSVVDLDASLVPSLQNDPPDVVIPLVHGAAGRTARWPMFSTRWTSATSAAVRWPVGRPSTRRSPRASSPTTVCRCRAATPAARHLPRSRSTCGDGRDRRSARSATDGQTHLWGSAQEPPWSARPSSFPGDGRGLRLRGPALLERYVPGVEVAVSVVDLGHGPQACRRSRSCRGRASTTTRRGTRQVRPVLRACPDQYLAGRRVRGRRGDRSPGPGAARLVTRRLHHRRRRHRLPRGQRRTRHDRNLLVPAGSRRCRLHPGQGCRATRRASLTHQVKIRLRSSASAKWIVTRPRRGDIFTSTEVSKRADSAVSTVWAYSDCAAGRRRRRGLGTSEAPVLGATHR